MTADSEGFVAENWVTLGPTWAHIMPIGGTERFVAAQTEENITHQVTIRWRGDMTEPKIRFVYTASTGAISRVFLVHNVLDQDEGRRELDCLCEEIVTTGIGSF